MQNWQNLGNVSLPELAKAREELHRAVQLPAMGLGRSLLTARPDDSHTALGWEGGGWCTGQIPGSHLRARLRPTGLCLELETGGSQLASLALAGRTLEEALHWLSERVNEAGAEGSAVDIATHFELADHPLAHGARFRADLLEGHAELGRYFSNTQALLREVADGGTPILTWPHHFDMATLLPAGDLEGGTSQTVGVGLSPGDEHYDEPYFYVSPWPRPEVPRRPDLPAGHWQTESFFAAVLPASELLAKSDPRRTAHHFLEAAIAAARSLLG